jgi:alkanesulfonate monooxygenase SsuD/methylene tetrahydromethanopterin reductase-like flavin-dependent oxidoreductase (luciferase family)
MWLRSHWENYAEGKSQVGQVAQAADWRVARTIFVADDARTAASYGGDDASSPYAFYYRQLLAKMTRSKRLFVFKKHKDEPDEAVTLERVLQECVIRGTPDQVADQLLALRERIGDFGEIVYAGLDWVDPALAKRSMTLMAEQVMPRVNAAIAQEAGRAA